MFLTKWLGQVTHYLRIKNGDNLIDPNYSTKCEFILGKPTYMRLLNHMFKFEQLFRTFAFIMAIYQAKHLPLERDFDIKKEAFAALIRTSQTHFSSDLGKLSDIEVGKVQCMSLRLQMKHARGIFDAKMLPVIDSHDPLTIKLIRMKHQQGEELVRPAHFNKKATNQNLVRGQVGATWYKKQLQIKQYVKNCGVCNRFNTSTRIRSDLGNSLVRTRATLAPWQNVSIDPLGHVRVSTSGVNTTKVYPLIISDINSGGICFEILNMLEAKDVFLALSRVEFRFSVSIVQILSDKGSQLQHHLLGDQKNFYARKLGAKWGVFNNLPYSQHRNQCERKVQSAKKLIRQALCGAPGPMEGLLNWSMLETILCMSANMVNNCPY
jgi:hypothetical protein